MVRPFTRSENNKKIKILIVDDEKDIAITLKAFLDEGDGKEEGSKEFEVDVFNDPAIALSNFKPSWYDLLLIDILMPKMNGFELCEKLQNIDNKLRVCFITTSQINYHAVRDVSPASTEVDCFITKPIERHELIGRIKEELKRVP